MYKLEQFNDKKFRIRFLIKETFKWFFVLFGLFFLVNLLNIPESQNFDWFISNFLKPEKFISTIIFCLIVAFFYTLIKLITVKKNLKNQN